MALLGHMLATLSQDNLGLYYAIIGRVFEGISIIMHIEMIVWIKWDTKLLNILVLYTSSKTLISTNFSHFHHLHVANLRHILFAYKKKKVCERQNGENIGVWKCTLHRRTGRKEECHKAPNISRSLFPECSWVCSEEIRPWHSLTVITFRIWNNPIHSTNNHWI